MDWREWKRQKMEQEKHPPKPRRNTSELPPLTPTSVWVKPQPINLYTDFQLACSLFNDLTPSQRIRAAAGALDPVVLNAVKCGILLDAALNGDVFDLA